MLHNFLEWDALDMFWCIGGIIYSIASIGISAAFVGMNFIEGVGFYIMVMAPIVLANVFNYFYGYSVWSILIGLTLTIVIYLYSMLKMFQRLVL